MITVKIRPAKRLLARKQWRFTVHGGNGEILATSERYFNRGDAEAIAGRMFGLSLGDDIAAVSSVELQILDENGAVTSFRKLR